MNPVKRISLSGVWNFYPEGKNKSEIHVPGGGWLKQGFDCEWGIYERWLDIPLVNINQTTILKLGAVNHETRVLIGSDADSLSVVHQEVTAFTPQEADLSSFVQPGASYLLRIEVRSHQNGRPIAPHAANWCEDIARGIFRSVDLLVYPETFIEDIFIKSSITHNTLTGEIWIKHTGDHDVTVILDGELSSCSKTAWNYPKWPAVKVFLPAHSVTQVTSEPVQWKAGPDSWWWPNLPYQPDYRSQLHRLILDLRQTEEVIHTADVRFGFRETRQVGDHYELNGIKINYRGDNLQVANYDRINNSGKGNAIDTLPGFLAPSDGNPGWPQAVDNFLRLNFNVQRQHMGPWSPYMLDVCDERGLMLIGESAARLNDFDRVEGRAPWENKCLADMVRRDRNHPSIIRWSTVNEPQSDDPDYHWSLYETVKSLDDTRPVSEDIWTGGYMNQDLSIPYARLLDKNDFAWFEHYLSYNQEGTVIRDAARFNDALIPVEGRPYGIGESGLHANGNMNGLINFAASMALFRAQGAADARPYVLLSSWSSSIPGVSSKDFIIEGERFHPLYGEDNLPDPWGHAGIQMIQKAASPFLVMDTAFWHQNGDSNGAGAYPVHLPQITADSSVQRELCLFNDSLQSEILELSCSLTSGSLSNTPFAQDSLTLRIEPGCKITVSLNFIAPPLNCFIIASLQVRKSSEVVFNDNQTVYEVINGIVSEWNYQVRNDRSLDSLRLCQS